MKRTAAREPIKRLGYWYLIRRVPKEFAHLDRRNPVKISTDIAIVDDPKGIRAKQAVNHLNLELEAYWRGLRDGQSAEARIRFEAAQKRAKALGFTYQTVDDLASDRLQTVLERFEHLLDNHKIDDEQEVAAVLGGEPLPRFRVSGLASEYESLMEAGLLGMSERQRQRWRTPKMRAAQNFIDAVGEDLFLDDVRRKHGVKFREWWAQRLIKEGLDLATANKDIGHMNRMMAKVDMVHHLELEPAFAKLRFEGEQVGQRAAFTAEFVKDVLLAPGALDGLNEEARAIVEIVAELGLRPSEVCSAMPEHWHLSAPIPYVDILPEGRVLKNAQSERAMPLVGFALEAARRHPNGFPRYLGKSDSLSAAVNKFLRTKELLPTPAHTLYSLRHTFEDRLTSVETPEKIMAALMGHKYYRPKYGTGPTLAQKAEWLDLISFKRRHAGQPE